MKKIAFYITTALLTIFLVPTQAIAGSEDGQVTDALTETADAAIETAEPSIKMLDADEALNAESEALIDRLEEINEMDKSDLTRSEKRELRNEVREIDKALSGGGVYLSVGALILVIVLLVLLL